ncbi:uncharacterized protein CLUP02_17343 [Colletotrichum lupini]|uniref:Uncharacterized protein n=1 Tax=Colletotrichum lupini TaxID=145971 RepID=A0A9Q8WA53_9PEZI|nr:uncharacterized protein CLUP02_17343 [Colletotrichum lupini]UQC75834.1 hypothetical protein CLUP02_17343 [Colletotrichum lupini]
MQPGALHSFVTLRWEEAPYGTLRFTGTEKRGDIEPNQALRQAEERGGGEVDSRASPRIAVASGPDDEPGLLVAETCKRCNLLPVSRRKVYSSPGYRYQETESAVMGDPEAKGPRPASRGTLPTPPNSRLCLTSGRPVRTVGAGGSGQFLNTLNHQSLTSSVQQLPVYPAKDWLNACARVPARSFKITQKVGNGYRNSPTHPWQSYQRSTVHPRGGLRRYVNLIRVAHLQARYLRCESHHLTAQAHTVNPALPRLEKPQTRLSIASDWSSSPPSAVLAAAYAVLLLRNLRLPPISPLQSSPPPVVPIVKRLHRDPANEGLRLCGFAALRLCGLPQFSPPGPALPLHPIVLFADQRSSNQPGVTRCRRRRRHSSTSKASLRFRRRHPTALKTLFVSMSLGHSAGLYTVVGVHGATQPCHKMMVDVENDRKRIPTAKRKDEVDFVGWGFLVEASNSTQMLLGLWSLLLHGLAAEHFLQTRSRAVVKGSEVSPMTAFASRVMDAGHGGCSSDKVYIFMLPNTVRSAHCLLLLRIKPVHHDRMHLPTNLKCHKGRRQSTVSSQKRICSHCHGWHMAVVDSLSTYRHYGLSRPAVRSVNLHTYRRLRRMPPSSRCRLSDESAMASFAASNSECIPYLTRASQDAEQSVAEEISGLAEYEIIARRRQGNTWLKRPVPQQPSG